MAIGWAAIGWALVKLVVAALASFVVGKLAEGAARKRLPGPEAEDISHLLNTTSTDAVKPLIYGRCRVGVNWAYKHTTGTDNKFLHLIGNIGEGPIYGIVREDGTTFTSTGTEFPSSNPPKLYLDGELWTTKWTDYCYAEFFTGSATQNVCSTLATASVDSLGVQQWDDPKRYTAYVYLRLKWDNEKWLSIPDVTLEIDGLQLYDPVSATTAYSTNFALMAYDMLTRPTQRGGLGLDTWHGPVPASPRVVVDNVEDARDYCTAKDWTGGLVIRDDDNFADQLMLIMNCFRGDIVYSEGLYKMRFRDLNHESFEDVEIVESDVVVDDGRTTLSLKPLSDLYETANAIEIEYLSEEKQYQKDVWLKTDDSSIVTDGGMRKTSMKLLGLNTLEKVQPMAAYHLERLRWGHKASLRVRDAYLGLEAMDLIYLTHELPGWDERPMRVVSTGYSPSDHTIALELEEEDSSLYDDLYNIGALPFYTTTLISPTATVPNVTSVSISETVHQTRLRSFTRLIVEFSAPLAYPWWDGAQVWVRIDGGDWSYMTKSRDRYYLDGVEEGVLYEVRLVSTNIWGNAQDFDLAYTASRTVTGMTTAPPDLTGMTAVANGDSVSIYANPLDADDVEGYEVRMGSAWLGGLFVSFNKAPSLRLSGVRPGTHTFWMTAKNNAGLYASNPVSATCRVFIPPGYTSDATTTWDYSSGTFTNAEADVYNTEDILRGSHTAGNLVGSWTSPTYDNGSIKSVRCWAEISSTLIATSSTWNGVMPSPNTWADVGADTMTWRQLFAPSASANIRAILHYSTDDVDWDEVDFFEVLCAEVSARYFKVELEITDTALDSYLYVYELPLKIYAGPQ